MPSKSQSPGPSPTSSAPPKTTRSRKNINKIDQTGTEVGRVGSAGGGVLEKAQPINTMSSPAPSKNAAASTPLAANDATTTTPTTGPNRQRRRPRKLNKEPATGSAQDVASAKNPAKETTTTTTTVPTTELESLKLRVRGLEAKVEELYKSGSGARTDRSPRRRGKGRKNSSKEQVPTTASTTAANNAGETTGTVEEIEEADEELERLEGELESARRDLALARPRPRPRRSASDETEYIEEVPRDGAAAAAAEDTAAADASTDRQVTLTGSYRIPLPANVNMSDVKTIQSGVSAAQNVAKSFLEQRRVAQAAAAAQSSQPPPPAAAARSSKTRSSSSKAGSERQPSMEVSTDKSGGGGGGQSWSEWIGGYSMAISRAAKNIQAEAAIESQRPAARPAQAGRTASTPNTKTGAGVSSKKTGTTAASKAGKGAKTQPVRTKQGGVSSEQV